MKKLILSLGLLLSAAALADDSKAVTFEGKITGVVCASCKAHITAALTQKLPDVVSVDVKPGEDAESQKIIIITRDESLTKDKAVDALGAYAKNYQILSLAKK
ncbi:MAG TPA: hypothetical protein DIT64_10910 [Verrucomicrobiales bacterium]|nr:hypothetical protein [Verrucomicrobiales bacterium]